MVRQIKKAFTLVELLTVISIIALIIGLLVPALNQVKRISKDTKQRVQFHAISSALEMFKTEQDEYPDSKKLGDGTTFVCGAHRLAEAVAGRDLQGFDPKTSWHPGINTIEAYGYTSGTFNQNNFEASLERRKGPYLSLDNVSIFSIGQIYTNPAAGSSKVYTGPTPTTPTTIPAPVITDVYTVKRITIGTSQKSIAVGSPVLYYKANIAKKFNDTSASSTSDNIYDIDDNDEIVKLGTVKDQTIQHKINAGTSSELVHFYDDILKNKTASQQLTGSISRPYRYDSYVLISAGFDGIYGTDDDITNFGE